MSRISDRLGTVAPATPHRRQGARQRPSAARDRILTTADSLFYRHGIHGVGVDRIITEAGATRATFYRHFPSKNDVIEAYLRTRGDRLRESYRSGAHGQPPQPPGAP
ncbi:MAG: TetR/AcrR family transcriptional regulator [Actinobacteria bacterium]|nr:TetR/AcrR family transcriptional regulator [Actinomycetota bacterium]MBU1608045.1 TetR/AcrR family transcriptional regulator [Actinomycetota bacterium]MBU2315883.1 TetR/AcrR family transcriptional regulator [Actinomycetota bacterium]MBU2385883.1 TetR/AcrR family transcriptional regulator [Actinomycetota bacterium]